MSVGGVHFLNWLAVRIIRGLSSKPKGLPSVCGRLYAIIPLVHVVNSCRIFLLELST